MPYERKPVPIDPPRARCPVCGAAVYSPAGIHPQCAMARSDPLRRVAKAGRRGPAAAGPGSPLPRTPAAAELLATAIPPDRSGPGEPAPG